MNKAIGFLIFMPPQIPQSLKHVEATYGSTRTLLVMTFVLALLKVNL